MSQDLMRSTFRGVSSRWLVALLVVGAAVAAPAARADGDPASDVLLSQQTFVSPNAQISSSDKLHLDALLTAARRRGYTVRVAVIQSRYDLGAVTVLDKKPRLYAHFLSQELQFVYKKRLLVVMPNGYGIANGGKPAPAEQAVLDRLSPAGSLAGSALVGAAVTAVHALTAHAGVPIAGTHASHGIATGNRIAAAAVGLLLLFAGAFTVRRRSAARRA
jgi:hypothetical protein